MAGPTKKGRMIRNSTRKAVIAGLLAALTTTALGLATTGSRPVEAASVYQAGLRTAILKLPGKIETPAGYQRALFTHWVDQDRDGLDTRAEVLNQESRAPVAMTGGTVVNGKWVSYYDNATWTRASDVDIDHLVPLKEAWDSGAKQWTAATRRAFANDLGDLRSLVAVTDNVNQAKADKDPAQWMPSRSKCRYLAEWVAVKHRWNLSVDNAERAALLNVQRRFSCAATIKVTKATVKIASGGGSTGGGGSPAPQCAAAYPTVCIPPAPPDLDCGDVPFRKFKVVAPDPHRFDSDKDGLGCES
jgi:hypothetical protein